MSLALAGTGQKAHARPTAVAAASLGLVVALVAGVYAVPRLAGLAAVPRRLDTGLAAAGRYNEGLETVVRLEGSTATSLDGLDELQSSLGRLRGLVAGLGPELAAMVPSVGSGLASPLSRTADETAGLQLALERLERALGALEPPFAGSAATLSEARRVTDGLLANLGATATQVHRATVAVGAAAADVAGPTGPTGP